MARRRTLYQPVMIAAAVAVACAVALLVVSEKAGATFPGKNGRIAYAGWNRGKDFEIYTINPDGSGKTQLTHNNTDDLDPAYSPDGKRIAYTDLTLNEPGPHIYSIKAGGGDKTLVARSGGVPSYSPDGKRIAYECYGRPPQDRHRHLHDQRAQRAQARQAHPREARREHAPRRVAPQGPRYKQRYGRLQPRLLARRQQDRL
jgi:dipeptidyl aminopeptidase/acylaminoacyl peptidase